MESCRVVKLTTHFYLIVELHLHFPFHLHGVMLDCLTTRIYPSTPVKFDFYIAVLNEDVLYVILYMDTSAVVSEIAGGYSPVHVREGWYQKVPHMTSTLRAAAHTVLSVCLSLARN
jgi:hypothetical protein